jgi:uncharacterized protein involved in exopolysaccharide biosynthesis
MPDDRTAIRAEREEWPAPTLRDVLMLLFRRRKAALSTWAAFLAFTVLYFLTVPQYQAHMRVLLRRERVDPIVSSDQNPPQTMARPEISEEDLNSEVELLHDQELLGQVVKQNGLRSRGVASRLHLSDEGEEVEVARGVRRLASQLKVEPIRKSNLILISYDSADPALGARVLNSLARLYVEKHKEVGRFSEETPFFIQQAEQSRMRLNQAELQLLDFSQDRGVVAGTLERDLALQRAGEIETVYGQTAVAIEETSRRIEELRRKLASFPERSTSLVRTSDNPQLLETLKGRLLELQLKRTALLTKFQPSYRLVQEVEEQINEAQSAISAERLSPVREETTEKDPNHEWAKADLSKAEVELGALKARQQATALALAAARSHARMLGNAAIQQQDLLRGMKTAEESYLLYARKSEEARITDALDERGIVNVALAEAPVAPVLPKHSPWVVLFVGAVAGIFAGIGMAFAVDSIDPAFRTPEEVVEYLRAPVLASLPREVA